MQTPGTCVARRGMFFLRAHSDVRQDDGTIGLDLESWLRVTAYLARDDLVRHFLYSPARWTARPPAFVSATTWIPFRLRDFDSGRLPRDHLLRPAVIVSSRWMAWSGSSRPCRAPGNSAPIPGTQCPSFHRARAHLRSLLQPEVIAVD